MQLRIEKFGPVSKEAFSPLRTYHLSRGLTIEFNPTDLIVRGGPNLYKSYALEFRSDDDPWMTPEASSSLVSQVESDIGVKVVAVSNPDTTSTPKENCGTYSRPRPRFFQAIHFNCRHLIVK